MADNGIGGRRAKIIVNGLELARAAGVDYTESVQAIRINCMGNIYSEEIVRNGVEVSGTMRTFRFIGQSLKELGVMAGGETLERIMAGSLTIQIYDPETDQNIETLTGAKISGRTVSIDADSVMMEDVTFEALRSRTGELGL